jgi:hypothetical protein
MTDEEIYSSIATAMGPMDPQCPISMTWVCGNCGKKIDYRRLPVPVRVDTPDTRPIGIHEVYDLDRSSYEGREMKIHIWCHECAGGLKR